MDIWIWTKGMGCFTFIGLVCIVIALAVMGVFGTKDKPITIEPPSKVALAELEAEAEAARARQQQAAADLEAAKQAPEVVRAQGQADVWRTEAGTDSYVRKLEADTDAYIRRKAIDAKVAISIEALNRRAWWRQWLIWLGLLALIVGALAVEAGVPHYLIDRVTGLFAKS